MQVVVERVVIVTGQITASAVGRFKSWTSILPLSLVLLININLAAADKPQ